MAYTHTTLAQFRSQIAARLGDSGNVFWASAELDILIKEALRTWALLTGYWRDRGTFNTTSGTAFYNINSLVNAATDPLLSSIVTDRDLVISIQYSLIEPATAGATWTGSEQFTLDDIAKALTRRRDQLLSETACTLSITNNLAATSPYWDTPTTTVNIRRLAFKGNVSGNYMEISAEGTSRQRSYQDDYILQQGVPGTYSIDGTSPLRLRIAPLLNEPGIFNMISVETGAVLDPANANTALGIPDNMAWVLKWGVLADLLGKDGPGRDMNRAYFCERRYQFGVALAKIMPTVLAADLNGLPVDPVAMHSIDSFLSGSWETTTAAPTLIGTARNIICVAKRPDGVYSVGLDVVRKAVLPANDADYLQVGKEEISPLVDYVIHLASFKMGGVEFMATYRAADNFYDAALRYNQRTAGQTPDIITTAHKSIEDFFRKPYMRDGAIGSLDKPADKIQ